MRLFVKAAIVSGALVTGLAATGSPVLAAEKAPADFGVEAVVDTQGALSSKAFLAVAKSQGLKLSAKQVAAIKKKDRCRWQERTQGRKRTSGGRWLIYVRTRLNWCYDGYDVVSARATYRSYTYNRSVWRWRGWSKKSLKRSSGSWAITTKVKGKFYYTGNGRTYRPWATITGYGDGGYRWWAGNN